MFSTIDWWIFYKLWGATNFLAHVNFRPHTHRTQVCVSAKIQVHLHLPTHILNFFLKNECFFGKYAKVRSHIACLKKCCMYAHCTHVSKWVSHAHRTRANVHTRVHARLIYCWLLNDWTPTRFYDDLLMTSYWLLDDYQILWWLTYDFIMPSW